ncbi:MAG: TolB family protein [Nannocystales bacterium]
MTGDSRTDLEALRRSGSGKILALGVLLLAALGAASWFLFFRAEGIGAPERADKVLVVRAGNIAGYSAVLGRDGFDAAEGSLEHWVEKARLELPDPPEGTDVQIVLTLADHFGYGYVVFEHPAEVDFSEIDIEGMPEFEEHVRFAALSVGDFAFPHQMTVNPEPSTALRRVEIGLLQALFAQEALAQALPENDSASVESIQLRSRLEDAIVDLDLVDRAEALAEETVSEISRVLREERGRNQPVRLAGDNDGGRAVPNPRGGVVSLVRHFDVVSDDGIRAELEWSPQEVFTAPQPSEQGRAPLCAPMFNHAALDGPPVDLIASPDGAALLIERRGRPQQVWMSSPQAECGYVFADLPESGLQEVADTVPGREFVARLGTIDAEATFEFVDALKGTATLVELTGVAIRDAAWLDARFMAATGDDGLVYLLDAKRESKPLSVMPTKLGRDPALFEVAKLSDDSLVLTVGAEPRRLVRLQANVSWGALFQAPPALPALEPTPGSDEQPQDPPAVTVRLDSAAFTTTTLTRAGIAREPVGSPDGSSVAFTILDRALDDPGQGRDSEIALIGAAGGDLELLTKNGVRDRSPRFTADGGTVLFQTRVEMPRSSWRVEVPRGVAVR